MQQRTALFICFVLSILLSSSLVLGVQIDELKITADVIEETVYLNYLIRITGEQQCISNLQVHAPLSSEVIYAKDDFGDISITQNDTALQLQLPVCVDAGEERTLLFKIKSQSILQQQQDQAKITFDWYPRSPTSSLSYIVQLPETITQEEVIAMQPEAEKLAETPLTYRWKHTADTPAIFQISYKAAPVSVYYWLGWLVGIICVLLIICGIYVARGMHKKQRYRKVLSLLNTKERLVMEQVLLQEGITQNQVQKKTQLTRSNLSKIVAKLERRALLEKRDTGRMNRLYLGEKFKEQ